MPYIGYKVYDAILVSMPTNIGAEARVRLLSMQSSVEEGAEL